MNEVKKLKIGIDLDDVVFDFISLVLKKYKEIFEKEILFEEVSSFYFSRVFNLSQEKVDLFFKKILIKESVENLELCEFAKEIILELSKNNKIFFITSRVHAKDGTLESLNKNFSEINFELIFSSNPYHKNEGKSKGEICKELGINFMIEDDIKHCEECIQKGIKVFLLDKPWNQKYLENEDIIRVKNWNEILNKLK